MLDRTVAPEFHEIEKLNIRQAEKYDSTNHLPFYFVRSGGQPVIKLEFILSGGTWNEHRAGAAELTSRLLTEGTKSYSSAQISENFDALGAFFEINSGVDFITVNFYFLEKHLQGVLPMIREILEEPTFPNSEFETVKNISFQTLKVNFEKTSFLASKHFRMSLFGESHPYGKIIEPDQIGQLEVSNIAEHYQGAIRGKHTLCLASGQFSDDTLHKLGSFISSLDFGPSAATALEHGIPERQSAVQRIEKEGSVQGSIRIGKTTITPSHDDYFNLMVSNEVLGGYFGSRLMKNIREEKGLTYGIYSQIVNLNHSSFFTIGADVRKELIDQAIDEVKKEIRILRSEPVEWDELQTVRNYLLGQIQSSINTPFALADKFKTIFLRGFDYSYYDGMVETIKSITPDKIMETTEKYLHEDTMNTVVVG